MAHFGDNVEQALHYLLRLGAAGPQARPSAREMADFYNLAQSSAGKLFTRLEKAGLVVAEEGREGGFRLARPLAEITVLEVADTVEGRKPVFRCKDIRTNCAVFGGQAPDWATRGVCAVHAAMIDGENAMRDRLAAITLQDIQDRASRMIPEDFGARGNDWFADRRRQRRSRNKQEPS